MCFIGISPPISPLAAFDGSSESVRIGELAARVGITVDAIRFYERTGVIPKPNRNRSGYRIYDEQAFRTLVVVRWAQEIGLPLDEISAFFQGPNDPAARLERLTAAVAARRIAIAREKKRLTALEGELDALTAVPFEGGCLFPASFVDRLVLRHEEGIPRPAERIGASPGGVPAAEKAR